MVKLAFDAGHGGSDSGAIGFGVYEKNVVLKLAQLTKDYMLQNYQVEILMTRETDVFVGLSERARYANNNNVNYFVSFHNNAANTQAHGFETFVWNGGIGQSTLDRQNVIHNEIMNYLKPSGISDRGKKRADYAVLRETNMEAILIEYLFIDHQGNNQLLQNNDFLVGLAKATGDGIAKALNIPRKQIVQPQPSTKKSKYFNDIPDHMEWIIDAADRNFERGLIVGSDGKLNSTANLSRGEMTVIVDRIISRLENKK